LAWFGKDKQPPAQAGDPDKPIEIGWLVDENQPSLLFGAPQPLDASRVAGKGETGSPVQVFSVACPYDLHISLATDASGKLGLRDVTPGRGPQTHRILSGQVTLMGKERWRDPKRPLLQFGAPWRFVTDEVVTMTQLPAFAHYRTPPWPGVMIGGRFPIHVWPRSLMWAFDWWDSEKPLVMKRGEPWFYLRFESEDPSRPVRLVEAEATPALTDYCAAIDQTGAYVRDERELFAAASARRPASLLTKKERG
jgi:hypothetical protein